MNIWLRKLVLAGRVTRLVVLEFVAANFVVILRAFGRWLVDLLFCCAFYQDSECFSVESIGIAMV